MQTEITDSTQTDLETNTAIALKGSVFTLPILEIRSSSIEAIEKELGAKLSKAKKFFENAPVVIDLQEIAGKKETIDFSALMKLIGQNQLIAVGVRNGSSQLNALAISAGLAVLKGGAPQNVEDEKSNTKKPDEKTSSNTEAVSENKPLYKQTKLVTQPVRSGQQIYAVGADLIVMAPVSPGAEVIADGNIHVYSTMRGRALAGVRGDVKARIFCQSMQAELIAIAGNFRVFEDTIPEEIKNRAVQAFLDGENLKIVPL